MATERMKELLEVQQAALERALKSAKRLPHPARGSREADATPDTTAAIDTWKAWKELPDNTAAPAAILEPDSGKALADFITRCGGKVVLIDGHGAKNQYKDMDEAAFKEKLAPVVEHLDKLYNTEGSKERGWVAMYGGDPYEPNKCVDAAYIVHVLHREWGVKVIATQCDLYGKYIMKMEANAGGGKKMTLNDSYACLEDGAVMMYKTQYRENAAGQKEILYGGLDERGQYCGATKLWLDPHVEPLVAAHLVMGGGMIALQNAQSCFEVRKRVLYIPCAANIVPEDKQRAGEDWYGQVHDFMMEADVQGALTNDCWRRMLGAGSQPQKPMPFFEFDGCGYRGV